MKLLILSLLLSLIACKEKDIEMEKPYIKPIEPQTTSNYLALGDSYTIGEGVLVTERWPVQLAAALTKDGIPVETPQIIARTGWTTDELMLGIEAAQVKDTFDLVSLLIGVNNQYRGRSTEQFRTELILLINKALTFAGNDTSKVFMLSIPDWGVTPFAEGRDRAKIAREIDAFNYVIWQETSSRNILFVDITRISREALTDQSLLAADRLHPSGSMYGRWVEELLPKLKLSLQKP
jgi:lysophospholipase L1-like esterase